MDEATLRALRAFVVRLRAGSSLQPDQISGQAEHVESGRASSFMSAGELVAFMTRVVREQEKAVTEPAASGRESQS